MPPMTGMQEGVIRSSNIYTKDNGTVDIAIKMEFAPGGEFLTSHIYITEKAKGIARARLKKCGFDPDAQDVNDLDNGEHSPIVGNSVLVDVFENEYPVGSGKKKLKAEIPLERQKPDARKVKAANNWLREAKGEEDGAEEGSQTSFEGFPHGGGAKGAGADKDAPF
jgi:hypothetical protein